MVKKTLAAVVNNGRFSSHALRKVSKAICPDEITIVALELLVELQKKHDENRRFGSHARQYCFAESEFCAIEKYGEKLQDEPEFYMETVRDCFQLLTIGGLIHTDVSHGQGSHHTFYSITGQGKELVESIYGKKHR